MARPKINPDIRFADCKDILRFVLERGHGEIDCLTPNACVNMLQRLNTYRKIVRDNSSDGIVIMDAFVFLRRGNKIVITPRPIIDPSQLYDEHGNSLGEDFKRWKADDYKRQYGQYDTQPQTKPIDDDPNPFAQDKPLKLNDD